MDTMLGRERAGVVGGESHRGRETLQSGSVVHHFHHHFHLSRHTVEDQPNYEDTGIYVDVSGYSVNWKGLCYLLQPDYKVLENSDSVLLFISHTVPASWQILA